MVSRGLGSARGTDDAAVAHDNNAVGYLENLSQAMRDEYDGDATLAEPTHAVEQALCLAIGQRRGRFVENQQPGILGTAGPAFQQSGRRSQSFSRATT